MSHPPVRAVALLFAFLAACGESPASPEADPPQALMPESIIEALEYWAAEAGITYQLIDENVQPRVLIRPGTDGLAPQGGGRAVLDGVYTEDNRARSGLVVFEHLGGQYCAPTAAPESCLYLHRHEIGHTLGFLDHSERGLMASGPPFLTDRERNMITALYSLPHGTVVEPDGRWSVPGTGESGMLADAQAAQDIIAWNMNARGSSSYRQEGVITRWDLPVRVYIQQ